MFTIAKREDQGLVATRARSRSDNHAGCHSLRSRRFATLPYPNPATPTKNGGVHSVLPKSRHPDQNDEVHPVLPKRKAAHQETGGFVKT